MTDEDLTGAEQARARARTLLAKAAERRAGAVALPAAPAAEQGTPLERIGGLHDLLRDVAAYLGDRPQRDRDAMGLYGRVMRMLGTGVE
jgi:hypothetical protein